MLDSRGAKEHRLEEEGQKNSIIRNKNKYPQPERIKMNSSRDHVNHNPWEKKLEKYQDMMNLCKIRNFTSFPCC